MLHFVEGAALFALNFAAHVLLTEIYHYYTTSSLPSQYYPRWWILELSSRPHTYIIIHHVNHRNLY
jgi:hypothetical protein